MKPCNALIATTIILLLTACQSSSITAMDRLTGTAQNDGHFSRLIQSYPLQTRFLSVNGQLPIDTAGLPCIASSYRVAYTMICLTREETQLLVHSYTGGDIELSTVKKALRTLDNKAQQVVNDALLVGKCKLQDGANCSSLTNSLANSKEAFDTQKEEVSDMLSANNLFIFQWSDGIETDVKAEADELVSAGANLSSANNGFTIVSGLKLTQLLAGHDFDDIYQDLPDHTKVATLVLQAEKIAYSSSRNLALSAMLSLDLSVEQYQHILKTLSGAEKIALRGALSYSQNLSNEGQFSLSSRKSIPLLEGQDTERSQDSGGLQTFYSAMTDLEDLRELTKPIKELNRQSLSAYKKCCSPVTEAAASASANQTGKQ